MQDHVNRETASFYPKVLKSGSKEEQTITAERLVKNWLDIDTFLLLHNTTNAQLIHETTNTRLILRGPLPLIALMSGLICFLEYGVELPACFSPHAWTCKILAPIALARPMVRNLTLTISTRPWSACQFLEHSTPAESNDSDVKDKLTSEKEKSCRRRCRSQIKARADHRSAVGLTRKL